MISFHIVPEHGNLYMMNNKNVEADNASTFILNQRKIKDLSL